MGFAPGHRGSVAGKGLAGRSRSRSSRKDYTSINVSVCSLTVNINTYSHVCWVEMCLAEAELKEVACGPDRFVAVELAGQ